MNSQCSSLYKDQAISDTEDHVKGHSASKITTLNDHGSRKPSYSSVREDATAPQSFSELSAADFRAVASELQRHQESCTNYLHEAERRLRIQCTGDAKKFDRIFQVFLDQLWAERAVDRSSFRFRSPSSAHEKRPSFDVPRQHEVRALVLDGLPQEILEHIFDYLSIRTVSDPSLPCRSDLLPCLLASKRFYTAALRALYKQITIPQSKTFSKLTKTLDENDDLTKLIRRLDFSHYSNMGYGRSRAQSANLKYITSDTLSDCLLMCTNLEEFLVHHHLSDELDEHVLQRLFAIPNLKAVDFCASSSPRFEEAFVALCERSLMTQTVPSAPSLRHLKRLSLHECSTLPQPAFEFLLPQLESVTHLDLAHTLVNDKALLSLPSSAQLTHLNLERCTRLTGDAVVTFLTTHPAASQSLLYLNLLSDPARHRLLSADDVRVLLSALPSSLKSLNIGGARLQQEHTCLLRPLLTHLEELGLKGAELSVEDLTSLFQNKQNGPDRNFIGHSSLRYIDLTDIPSVTYFSLMYHPEGLTSKTTSPLQVIEVGEPVYDRLRKRRTSGDGWILKEFGRRGWYVKQPTREDPESLDDGHRSWKMGARWWGTRKIPVAEQEVGGQYGYYMFKRA